MYSCWFMSAWQKGSIPAMDINTTCAFHSASSTMSHLIEAGEYHRVFDFVSSEVGSLGLNWSKERTLVMGLQPLFSKQVTRIRSDSVFNGLGRRELSRYWNVECLTSYRTKEYLKTKTNMFDMKGRKSLLSARVIPGMSKNSKRNLVFLKML